MIKKNMEYTRKNGDNQWQNVRFRNYNTQISCKS